MVESDGNVLRPIEIDARGLPASAPSTSGQVWVSGGILHVFP